MIKQTSKHKKRTVTISEPGEKKVYTIAHDIRFSHQMYHGSPLAHALLYAHAHTIHTHTHTYMRRCIDAMNGHLRGASMCTSCMVVRVRVRRGSASLRGRPLCVGLECVLGRSALTFRRGRAMVSRLLLRAG